MDRTIDSKVVNVDQLTLEHFAKGDRFESNAVRIGPLLGARGLGYSYDVVPAGKRSCPFHSHRGEEEMFFIVKGEGTLRYGNETRRVRTGDVICCPVGGPESAHQIVNDSGAELAYLSISTMLPVEVCEYPDSKKIGIFSGAMRHMTHSSRHLDYWTDEV
ncbi:MAG: cupin domain-containing protein [Casimicrobiaceae bacterium]